MADDHADATDQDRRGSRSDGPGRDEAALFGRFVRERRRALAMSQEELALATGVGRRFIIELEAGKPTLQLGRALAVAEAVGLRLRDLLIAADSHNALLPEEAAGKPPVFSEDSKVFGVTIGIL